MVVTAMSAAVSYLVTGEPRVVWGALGLTAAGVLLGLTSVRVRDTVAGWLDPFADPGQAGGGLGESLLAIGSGNLSGAGLGMGDPGLIPHASSDWILAALGEELGLAGTVALIALHALLVAAGMGVALSSRDLFSKVTAATLSALLALMFLAGAAGLERLLPPTRMGLPFLAYGGFPLLAGWLTVGLLLRISHGERGPL
jgi:cell division protein FtsW